MVTGLKSSLPGVRIIADSGFSENCVLVIKRSSLINKFPEAKAMAMLSFPYGKSSIKLDIPDIRLRAVLTPGHCKSLTHEQEEAAIRHALQNPIGSPPLYRMVKNKKNIVIIASDHTRPVPSKTIMPIVLEEIRRGNPGADITILIATGMHRGSTGDELIEKFGRSIVDNERIVVHDSYDLNSVADIGVLPSGGRLELNKTALEADFLMAEGFIEPHFFAGFSGGRKSVLPGIASEVCVRANHCARFIASDKAVAGNLEGNPLQIDMLYAAEKANLAFIINVLIDEKQNVLQAFAGHWNLAHIAGTEALRAIAQVEPVFAPIVITGNGGYPLDQNVYQAVKSMSTAELTCSPGGVIIALDRCEDGHGDENFYRVLSHSSDPGKLLEDVMDVSSEDTEAGQWEYQILARILQKFKVIMVTEAQRRMIEDMGMLYAESVEKAILMAEEIVGDRNAPITAIPNGIAVFCKTRTGTC